MKRNEFISSLIAISGLSLIPNKWVKNYHKIYLLQCFVAGFRFYKGPKMLDELKEGQLLKMVREHDNMHDDCAIALYYNDEKIGFIPASENEMLSRLLDAEVIEMLAEITHLEPKAAAWENVSVGVYVLKETKLDESIPEKSLYLGELYSPEYTTLKWGKEHISRVYITEELEPNETALLWEKLKETSTNDVVYDYLMADYPEQPKLESMLVNLNKINRTPNKGIAQKIKDLSTELDSLFNEKGYISVSIETAAEFIDHIDETIEVFDKNGKGYLELVLV